jgi:hypothetical protein
VGAHQGRASHRIANGARGDGLANTRGGIDSVQLAFRSIFSSDKPWVIVSLITDWINAELEAAIRVGANFTDF